MCQADGRVAASATALFTALMASEPTRILLVRHGETVTNREGRFCGHSETDLTERGRQQAEALGRRLAALRIDAVYSSDLSRAVTTAALAAGDREIQACIDADLRELNYGDWEQEKERDIARRFPDLHRLMRDEDPAWQPPGGETIEMVRARTARAFWRLAKAHRRQTTLVVSHGTAIACMVAELLAVPLTHTFRLSVSNCGLTEIAVVNSRAVLVRLNETAHLPDAGSRT